MVLASDHLIKIFKTFKTFNNIYTLTRMMALRPTVAPFFRQCRYRSKNKNMLGILGKPRSDFFSPQPFPLFEDMERHLMPTSDWFRNLIPRVPQMAVSPIRIDFYQTENEYHLEADFTGLKREDVKVALDEEHNIFTVECIKDHAIPEEKVKKGEVNYHRQERSIKLPTDADPKSAKCKFEEGVLKVSIPRTEFKKIEEKTLRIE